MKLWIRAAAFTLLIPGVVAVLIPHWLSSLVGMRMPLDGWRFVGVPLLVCGIVLYLVSLLSFVARGGGTPAIWFTAPVRFLIGEEPERFVGSMTYRWTRNPMYLGVLLSVFGQGLLSEDLTYCVYGAFLWAVFHAVVLVLEEPHLREKFGERYRRYCATTPRWFGFPKFRSGKLPHNEEG